jgi:drug/metabolite transporter (DMT)-like permease
MYYFNLVTLLLMWLSSKLHRQDIADIPAHLRLPLLKRVAGGFFSDILLYMAFRYTNYSKAICIMLTQNIMIPFVAQCFLSDAIRRSDIIISAVSFVGMVLIV